MIAVESAQVGGEVILETKANRNASLDALRGLAISLMVLSSSIAFGVLPGWMYHAQVPPPGHWFRPELPGITWVDLVFPLFLFSMGAALPLALRKKTSSLPFYKVLMQIIYRYFFLIVFAFFTLYARAWVMQTKPGIKEYLISILAFILLFVIYGDRKKMSLAQNWLLKIAGLLIAILFLIIYPFQNGFSITNTDIIILVLANMALFGSLIWWITKESWYLRIGILPFVMAVFLAAKSPGSINETIFNYTPAVWLYKFYYLKYLFMIIPGTLAGEWLQKASSVETGETGQSRVSLTLIACLPALVVLINIICLYSRFLWTNLLASVLLSALLIVSINRLADSPGKVLFRKLTYAGTYLLLLGLFFEAYEGGIKKDISTYSYYFVTTGLAFLLLLLFLVLEMTGVFSRFMRLLADTGKNPMIAYTAGNLFLIPILKITGADLWLDLLNDSQWGGFLRGVIFTSIVALITIFFTRKKIFWRT